MNWPMPIVLGSRSPRRQLLLQEAGIPHEVIISPIDDGHLRAKGHDPRRWAMGLAYLKATAVAESARRDGLSTGTVLAADTICVIDGEVIGQPVDGDHATSVLHAMVGRCHDVITGCCLLPIDGQRRHIFCDVTQVVWGEVSSEAIDAYVASEQWRGKAGGYNLAERLAQGWPITLHGDPATVMGLPMQLLEPMLVGRAS